MLAGCAVLLAFAGCKTVEPPPAPKPAPVREAPPPPIVGRATVDQVRVLKLESFPVQGFAYVTGYLPDRATRLGSATQRLEGADIIVDLPTERPADAVSATELVPFEHRIPLELEGLPKGSYRVIVNGMAASFQLERDNRLDEASPLDQFPAPY